MNEEDAVAALLGAADNRMDANLTSPAGRHLPFSGSRAQRRVFANFCLSVD